MRIPPPPHDVLARPRQDVGEDEAGGPGARAVRPARSPVRWTPRTVSRSSSNAASHNGPRPRTRTSGRRTRPCLQYDHSVRRRHPRRVALDGVADQERRSARPARTVHSRSGCGSRTRPQVRRVRGVRVGLSPGSVVGPRRCAPCRGPTGSGVRGGAQPRAAGSCVSTGLRDGRGRGLTAVARVAERPQVVDPVDVQPGHVGQWSDAGASDRVRSTGSVRLRPSAQVGPAPPVSLRLPRQQVAPGRVARRGTIRTFRPP